MNAYLKKNKLSEQFNFTHKELEKEEQPKLKIRRRKEITKIRSEINREEKQWKISIKLTIGSFNR